MTPAILSALDFLPTLYHLTGTPYGKDQFEGLDVSDIWLGGDQNPERILFWKKQYPAALDKNWKYHVNKQTGDELFDLVRMIRMKQRTSLRMFAKPKGLATFATVVARSR